MSLRIRCGATARQARAAAAEADLILFVVDGRDGPSALDDEILALAGGAGTNRGTGGMITKLQAAELATSRGIDMYITNGQKPETLYDIIAGEPAGTLFTGRKGK